MAPSVAAASILVAIIFMAGGRKVVRDLLEEVQILIWKGAATKSEGSALQFEGKLPEGKTQK